MSQPEIGKRNRGNCKSQVEEEPPEESKKLKRRVSFSDKAQVREFPKYLNNTDSSSECNSSHGDCSNANVTVTECIDMSLDTPPFLDVSFEPGLGSIKLSDMTQLLLGDLTAIYGEKGDEDDLPPKTLQPLSPLFERKENTPVKSFLEYSSLKSYSKDDSVLIRSVRPEVADYDEESLPGAFPLSRSSIGLGDLSRTKLMMTTMQDTIEDSKVIDHDFDISLHADVERSPKLSMELGGEGLNDIRPSDDFLESSLGQFSNITMANVMTNFVEASQGRINITNPVEVSIQSDDKILPTANSIRLNYSNLSSSFEDFEEALERVYKSALEEPAIVDTTFYSDKVEENLTKKRKNLNLEEMYENMKRDFDDPLDMTLLEIDDDEANDSIEESSREDELKEEEAEPSLEELRHWLKDLKRKLGEDDDELIQESYACYRPHMFSFVFQFWSTIFDFLANNSSDKKFHRCIDSIRTSKKNFEKSYKILDNAIKRITQNFEIKPDSSNPVVMVTRKTKSDLDEKKKEFFEQRNNFSELINEYLDYNVRSIDDNALFVGIQDSWALKFFFDQSAARSGVTKVTDVKSELLQHCLNHIRTSLGEHHRVRNDRILEHLLRDHLHKEAIKSEVDQLPSIIKTLERLASLHREASQISEFMNGINPMSLEEICSLMDDILTFEFMEPGLSLRFSVSTDEFRLPSLCQSPPKWTITKHRGELWESELRLAINIVKLDSQYYKNVYESITDWLRSLPLN